MKMIKGEIETRGISQKLLVQRMEESYTVLNEMLNGKHPVSTKKAQYLPFV